jgi:hypothetical protein
MEEWPTESNETLAESSEIVICCKSCKVPVDLQLRRCFGSLIWLLGIGVGALCLATLILCMLTPKLVVLAPVKLLSLDGFGLWFITGGRLVLPVRVPAVFTAFLVLSFAWGLSFSLFGVCC